MNRVKISKIAWNIVGFLLSFIVIIPFYFVLVNASKSKGEAGDMSLAFPAHMEFFNNFSIVFKQGHILNALLNSLIVTCLSVALIIILSAMIGFILARRRGKVSSFINTLIFIGIIVPVAIVPIYRLLQILQMVSTFQGVILLYVAAGIPLSVIIYKGFFKTIPKELDEAGIIDGCGIMRLFFSIIFPLLKHVTITVLVIQFLAVWNDLQFVLYFLNTAKRFTLPLTIYFFTSQYNSSWNLVFTDVVIIALPVVVIYAFAQKYIIAGMTSGAIKG